MIQLKNLDAATKLRSPNLGASTHQPGDSRGGIRHHHGLRSGKVFLLNVLALLDDQWTGEYWFASKPYTT